MAVAALETLRWTSPMPLLGLITKIDQPSLQIVQSVGEWLKGPTCAKPVGRRRMNAGGGLPSQECKLCRLVEKIGKSKWSQWEHARSNQVEQVRRTVEQEGARKRAFLLTRSTYVRVCMRCHVVCVHEVSCAPCVNVVPSACTQRLPGMGWASLPNSRRRQAPARSCCAAGVTGRRPADCRCCCCEARRAACRRLNPGWPG